MDSLLWKDAVRMFSFMIHDVHSREEFTLKGGDDVTFIFNEYGNRATYVKNPRSTNPSMIIDLFLHA